MSQLLKLSRLIDALTTLIGKLAMWMILATTLISASNAIVRKVFNISSNAFLEVQWYLFAASFLLAAGYTLLQGEHVKVDVISSRFSKRTQIWIDVFGYIVFLTPMCLAVLWYGIPFFTRALASGEMSNNAGGLIRWPVYLMMPLGFALLWLQGISELIKRLAFLSGHLAEPFTDFDDKLEEEKFTQALAEEAAQGRREIAHGVIGA